ncbi:MAG: hypothetical protein WCI18_10700 [Pseudomonadota bacterium]
MKSYYKKIVLGALSLLIASCNSNSTSTEAGIQKKENGSGFAKPETENRKSPDQISKALQYKDMLPRGLETDSMALLPGDKSFGIASSNGSVYAYLKSADEAYRTKYYGTNIKIVSLTEGLLKGIDSCNASIVILKTLDSAKNDFRDPYAMLSDIYEMFYVAAKETESEFCAKDVLK